MHKLYAEKILIGSEWRSDVSLSIASNGKISGIEVGQDPKAERLNGIVIPGMVNCHSHAFQRALAGFSEFSGSTNNSFWSWRDIMYRFVAKITPEDAYVVAKLVYIEMLKAGYTSVGEFHYLHHQANGKPYENPAEMSQQLIEAASSVGIAITYLPVLYSYSNFGEMPAKHSQTRFVHSTETYLRLVEKIQQQYSQNANFSLGIAPHSLRAVSGSQLRKVIPAIQMLNPDAPIHLHIAEQMQEVRDCQAHCGARPVDWLFDNFEVDSHWCLVHATHITELELTRVAQSGAVIGLCPTTEANLGDGIFPAQEFIDQGGRFAIGSDSHIAINVAEELRLLEYGQRLSKHQRAILTQQDCKSVGQFLYSKACQDGADAIAQNVGVIEIGKRADLVVLDAEKPSLYCKQDSFVLDAAIFASSQLPVKDVFVAGRRIVEAGFHPDEEAASKEYKKVLMRLTT